MTISGRPDVRQLRPSLPRTVPRSLGPRNYQLFSPIRLSLWPSRPPYRLIWVMTYTTTYVPSRAVPPAIAPYADPLNFCSPRIAEPVGPWARGKLVGARERTSRRRPAPPAVSRLMQRDLHPRHPPWPHGWHVAPGPRQDVVGWERLLLLRRRARNAPDQVDQRRAGDGRDLAGQREAAPGIMLLAHHRAPQTESANCTSSPSHD